MSQTLLKCTLCGCVAPCVQQKPVRTCHSWTQGYGEQLIMDGGINVATATAALAEGENDPRCLLLAFDCVQAACAAAARPDCAPRLPDFEREAGELFEAAVEPYFPVRFTPKKGDPTAITRRQLAGAIAACMAAAPEFAPMAVPLLSDKLGSSLRWVLASQPHILCKRHTLCLCGVLRFVAIQLEAAQRCSTRCFTQGPPRITPTAGKQRRTRSTRCRCAAAAGARARCRTSCRRCGRQRRAWKINTRRPARH